MSFARLNILLKEISASKSYKSIKIHLENDFSSLDDEKLVRVCLKKLSEWFRENVNEIKEIKIDFHRHFLRKSIRLKQKDLIDFLIEQLKIRFDDFLLYLLVEQFQKNYSILLDELEKTNDIDYLIHLPDRLANVSMRNLPQCFQIRSFFHRLSEHIEYEFVHRHYPNVVAGKDTNITFLSQLIHKAAKFGSTEFVWRPLLKNFFAKRCSNDSIWLRFLQFILCEPIDDVLFYTIQHSNADQLDRYLSERILHQKSLEIYFTETLLFHKTLPIEQIRTILIYLTLSTNRLSQCFYPVFHRYLSLWSDQRFLRFSSTDQHFRLCQSICLCLALEKNSSMKIDHDDLIIKIFNGIRYHLESTFELIRRRGQIIGELIINQMNLNISSTKNQLEFHGYDPNDSEVKIFKQLVQTPLDPQQRTNSDDEEEKIVESIQHEELISTNKTITMRDASIDDDDDDDDSEFESYDCSEDKTKSNVRPPTYIRSCLADLIATDQTEQLESALRVLPSLVQLYKIECEEVALELTRILLNYNSTFDIKDFHQLQLNGLITLTCSYPLTLSEYLTKEFYERNYTIQQRSLILKTIEETAKKLSQIESIPQEKEEEEEEDEEDEEKDLWRSIINQRLKLKTTYRRKSRPMKTSKENRFGQIVGHFFYPLISKIDQKSSHLSLIDGDEDHLLLCQLVACLGRLCICAQNTSSLVNLLKTFFQMLKSLEKHVDAGVRHAVIYAYACSLVSLNGKCYDEQIQNYLIDLKQIFDEIILKDSNDKVQKLTRSVRHILLKTLQEITND